MPKRLILAIPMLIALAASSQRSARIGAEPCALVDQALNDAEAIRPGMDRGTVEKKWKEDGGMNFRSTTYYIYQACDRIKIRVEFEPDANSRPPDTANGYTFSKTDTVKKVSRPYLEYPVKD